MVSNSHVNVASQDHIADHIPIAFIEHFSMCDFWVFLGVVHYFSKLLRLAKMQTHTNHYQIPL